MVRARYDLDKWRVGYFVHEPGLLSNWARRKNRWVSKQTRRHTLKLATLKSLQQAQFADVKARLRLEARLLFDAFEERGQFRYADEVRMPAGAENTGVAFQDPPAPQGAVVMAVNVHVLDGVLGGLNFQMRSATSANYTTQHRGSAGGKAQRFVIDDANGERLATVEGIAGRVIGRVRFITNRGRVSPWYGKNDYGDRFLLGVAPGKACENDAIVGLCGRATRQTVDALGVVVRHVTQTHVFSNCWSSRVLGDGDGEEGAVEERQFATVLRMRSADVQTALARSQMLARRLRSSEFKGGRDQEAVGSVELAFRLSCWLFEGLARGLVRLPRVAGRGEDLAAEGRLLVNKGRALLRDGWAVLKPVAEYRRAAVPGDDGGVYDMSLRRSYRLNPALLGETRVAELGAVIVEGIDLLHKGQRTVDEGEAKLARGKALMPQIPRTENLREYFEGLHKLAVVKDTLGATGQLYLTTRNDDQHITQRMKKDFGAHMGATDDLRDAQQASAMARVGGQGAVMAGLGGMKDKHRVW